MFNAATFNPAVFSAHKSVLRAALKPMLLLSLSVLSQASFADQADEIRRGAGFNRDAGIGIFGQHFVHDGIGNLVADLIGVPFRNGFTCKDVIGLRGKRLGFGCFVQHKVLLKGVLRIKSRYRKPNKGGFATL